MLYRIIFKGNIEATYNDKFWAAQTDFRKVDLPWDSEVVFTNVNQRVFLSFCAFLENKTQEVQEALQTMIKYFPDSRGEIYCYGDHSHDISRFVITSGRVHEQKAYVEYEEPGKVIFVA